METLRYEQMAAQTQRRMSKKAARVTRAGPRSNGVLTVLKDAWVYDRETDDRCPPVDDYKPPDGPLYLLGLVNEEPASLFIEHDSQIHYMVLRKHRMQARELLNCSIETSRLKFMFCQIPSLYMEVINFAKRSGFVETGVSEPRFMKSGVLYPVHRLELSL